MCTEPTLLCLDEPAAGLNPRESGELADLLTFIRDEHKTGVLLIEHDMSVVMSISDHIVVLDYGRKISDGRARPREERSRRDPRLSGRGGRRRRRDRLERRGGSVMILTVSGVHTFYGAIEALKGVDIEVAEGEIVTLIGANGAGKSTLLMTICGNPRARAGEVRFDGEDITTLPTYQIVRRGIAQSPEGRRIFPRMTVMENLRMGSITAAPGSFDDELERVFNLFPRLKERMNQRAGTLSGRRAADVGDRPAR